MTSDVDAEEVDDVLALTNGVDDSAKVDSDAVIETDTVDSVAGVEEAGADNVDDENRNPRSELRIAARLEKGFTAAEDVDTAPDTDCEALAEALSELDDVIGTTPTYEPEADSDKLDEDRTVEEGTSELAENPGKEIPARDDNVGRDVAAAVELELGEVEEAVIELFSMIVESPTMIENGEFGSMDDDVAPASEAVDELRVGSTIGMTMPPLGLLAELDVELALLSPAPEDDAELVGSTIGRVIAPLDATAADELLTVVAVEVDTTLAEDESPAEPDAVPELLSTVVEVDEVGGGVGCTITMGRPALEAPASARFNELVVDDCDDPELIATGMAEEGLCSAGTVWVYVTVYRPGGIGFGEAAGPTSIVVVRVVVYASSV